MLLFVESKPIIITMTEELQKKTILITGGAGFIGSALVRMLIQNPTLRVVNVDKLTYAASKNLESLSAIAAKEGRSNHNNNDNHVLEREDICDAAAMQRIFHEHQPDWILHLAAETHVDRSIDNPANFVHTNVVGTTVLLETARAYWMQLEQGDKRERFRFHHVSTDEVYGTLGDTKNDQKEDDALLLFTEASPYRPNSPYSASKAAADHMVRAWHVTYGLPVVITNCCNNYGPYQFPEKLIPLMILHALQGQPLPIYGSGRQVRDWIYVEDHVRALYKVACEGRNGETYNIGSHCEKTNLQVVHALCAALDERIPQHCRPNGISSFADLIEHVADRPGHDFRYAVDASKLQRELGWTPVETFESGIAKTVDWYLNNRDWCQLVQQDGTYYGERLGLGGHD